MKPSDPLPRASCICLTFGRPWFLAESIESFLRQDYAGESELIVLNDFSQQHLLFSGDSRVKLINVKRRFSSLGAKRNAAVRRATGDVILTWDDDDISLPGRIRQAVDNIQTGVDFYRPAWSWFSSDDGPPRLVHKKISWPQCAFTSDLFRRAGGYPPIPSGEDKHFAWRVKDLGCPIDFSNGGPEEATLIYRMWTDNPHATGISTGDYGYAKLKQLVNQRAPRGEIELKPRWERAYDLLCNGSAPTSDANLVPELRRN